MGRPAKRPLPHPRSFSFRAGVRISGTNLTCDAAGSASDLVFLSNAQAVRVRRSAGMAARRAGRRELLATDATLTLMGTEGQELRPHALPAPFGRPFLLGGMRLELFPSGYLPGAASLLCEGEGRRVLYAGTIRREGAAMTGPAAEVRSAEALCLDATFGSPRFDFPPRAQSTAAVLRFVAEAHQAGRAAVLLVAPFGPAMEVAELLAAADLTVRGHPSIVAAAARFRAAGIAPPPLGRFSGRLAEGEVLLWPCVARESRALSALPDATFAFVSGFSLEPEVLTRVRADVGIPLSNQAGFPELLDYVAATGAREVALYRGYAEEMAADLRGRGYDAYAVGPPTQMELFRG